MIKKLLNPLFMRNACLMITSIVWSSTVETSVSQSSYQAAYLETIFAGEWQSQIFKQLFAAHGDLQMAEYASSWDDLIAQAEQITGKLCYATWLFNNHSSDPMPLDA